MSCLERCFEYFGVTEYAKLYYNQTNFYKIIQNVSNKTKYDEMKSKWR